jgi:hypothetical protein
MTWSVRPFLRVRAGVIHSRLIVGRRELVEARAAVEFLGRRPAKVQLRLGVEALQ